MLSFRWRNRYSSLPGKILGGWQAVHRRGASGIWQQSAVHSSAGGTFLEVTESSGKKKKIGKVDFLLAQVENERAIDFAALEIQSVYISGRSIRPAFDHYVAEGELPVGSRRRPDFRFSAQKRLMPQLALKVPIFRRWGKRFFVAVDSSFFDTLPKFRTQTVGNAEVTWLVYPFERLAPGGYRMKDPQIYHTLWEDVLDSLREGQPPEKSELLSQLTKEIPRRPVIRT